MKLTVTCKCGEQVTITKADAARVLAAGRKEPSIEKRKEWGKKGAVSRWSNRIK